MKNVGEESRIPSIITPRVWMVKKALKTHDNNSGV
jgi:hypothetical protein